MCGLGHMHSDAKLCVMVFMWQIIKPDPLLNSIYSGLMIIVPDRAGDSLILTKRVQDLSSLRFLIRRWTRGNESGEQCV